MRKEEIMKKAQAFVITSLIVLSLLFAGIALFVSQTELLKGSTDQFGEFQRESEVVGNLLISQPYPVDYTKDTIKRVGIVDTAEMVSDESLARFAQIRYSTSKKLLGIRKEYLFFFTAGEDDAPINVDGREFFGWNGREDPTGGPKLPEAIGAITKASATIAKTERLVSLRHQDKLISARMVTYVFELGKPVTALQLVYYDMDSFLQTEETEYKFGEEVRLTE